jgi:hypothetical protein
MAARRTCTLQEHRHETNCVLLTSSALGTDRKEEVVAYFEVLPRHLSGQTGGKM